MEGGGGAAAGGGRDRSHGGGSGGGSGGGGRRKVSSAFQDRGSGSKVCDSTCKHQSILTAAAVLILVGIK